VKSVEFIECVAAETLRDYWRLGEIQSRHQGMANLGRMEFIWIPLILHALAWVFAGLAFLKIRE
jgi:hypothetical protein